jgi:hypothetical protein
MQICKTEKSKKIQINNYNFTTLQFASAYLQVHKFANLQN